MPIIDQQSVINWLSAQDDREAHITKEIIQNPRFNVDSQIDRSLRWLEDQIHNKYAGQAYYLLVQRFGI